MVGTSETIRCVLCGHVFDPGVADGYVYCSACGRRFNPFSTAEETVVLPPPDRAESAAPAEAAPPDDPSPSRRFGEYDILSEIARGGMGVVYLARQRVLRRVVALKLLRSGDNASGEERERLLREAKAAAGLTHPNIVPIHEFSIHQGQPYFTMDYIDGKPLDIVLEDGPLKVRDAVELIETVARAIAYAHTRGIIHRDLKPANIILTPDNRPMITDFGLAVDQTPETENRRRMTMAGAVMGTIPYAPPEQASGKIDQITERSDVYSMGAVLYEMVTGRPPFTGFTQFELMRRVINHDPAPPRSINPKVHRDVETIILKCLEKEQRRRYGSAKAFADDCQSFLKGEVITARPATTLYRCRRFITRRPLLNLLGALVVILSLAVWVGLDHFRALAKEKAATEEEKKATEQILEETIAAKEATEQQIHREWRTEYNINFDHYFRWVTDIDASHRQGIPWLRPDSTQRQAPVRAKLLADPPRLALIDPHAAEAEADAPRDGDIDMGLPFAFPREVRMSLRIQTPREKVGELLLSLDVGKDYRPHLGTTTLRFGSPARPGASFHRSGATIGEDARFSLRPGVTAELTVERSGGKLRALLDNALILETDDPPPVYNADAGLINIDVKDGTLEFIDMSLDLRGMSRNLATSLVETANAMAARGRAELAVRLYHSVLLEPTDAQNHLRALRGYARSLWLELPRRERGVRGVERACRALNEELAAAGRADAGMTDFLIGLSLSSGQGESAAVILEHLDRAEGIAYSDSSESTQYGDLARLERFFIYLRRNMLDEAARRFNIMFENGTTTRLYERFGSELAGSGQVALILEKVEPLLAEGGDLETAGTLLRAAAAIAPSSRESASNFRLLGNAYAAAGDGEKAVEMLHWAERMSPDWARPYLDEARIHFGGGDAGAAEEALSRGVAAIPQSLDLHLGIARLYLEELPETSRSAAAGEGAARAAVTLSQNANPSALELLAKALHSRGRHREALESIDAALRIESNPARRQLRDSIAKEIPAE